MFYLDCLVCFVSAFALDIPLPNYAPNFIWDSLKRVSYRYELVGKHERWASDFASEMRYVGRHYAELREAPPLSDSLLFPPLQVCQKSCSFNWNYQEGLKARKAFQLHKSDDIDEEIKTAEKLYRIWEHVREVQCEDRSWVCRRRALLQLRQTIEQGSYYRGELPPCVPIWGFRVIE
jgi:hypothetical protein